MKFACKLQEKSYPNFHIQCHYHFEDIWEDTNERTSQTRYAFAAIWTRENFWPIALEQEGYNERFIKSTVGEEEYARLESEVQGHEPIRGSRLPMEGMSNVAKKVRIPNDFDLALLSCKSRGFYDMHITIPHKEFRRKGR